MTPVDYARASSVDDAIMGREVVGTMLLGGGTNLVDLMRKGIVHPSRLIDVTRLSNCVEETDDGGVVIGAAARNSAVAAHPLVRARYPMLTRAILAGASAQIRNMATIGGNLMQRTRCLYFADVAASRCNRREPGSGCDAIGGFNRYHAVLGASSACIATHPSDMAVALAAIDARVRVAGREGGRTIALTDFHLLPDDHPERETALQPSEVIVAIELPPLPVAANSTYRKVRDRASYAFALVSVAAGLTVRDGRVADVRIALGGVAPKPWRAVRAEELLRGTEASPEAFADAAAAELATAAPQSDNGFKIELARRTVVAVLTELAETAR